jgi:hypothetical protein
MVVGLGVSIFVGPFGVTMHLGKTLRKGRRNWMVTDLNSCACPAYICTIVSSKAGLLPF